MSRVVLCVDDDPVTRSWLETTLDAEEGWQVRTASTLAAALDEYRRDPADVVLVDLALGNGSHPTSADWISRVVSWQPRPAVVVLTSPVSAELAEEAIDRGAQDWIDKRRFTTPVVTRVLDYAHRRHLAALRAAGTEIDDPTGQLAAYATTLWHDLRAPLATVVSMAEASRQLLELDDPPVETLTELARRTIELGHRALRFTDEVLRDVDASENRRTELDLAHVCRESWELLDPLDVMLELDIDVEEVYGLEGAMRQCLLNLFSNALRAVPLEGRVLVDTELRDVAVRIRVHDNGPGVPPEQRELIFRHGVSDGSSGTGLATVERQMARQSGRVWVAESDRLPGAMFVLELPYRQALRRI